MKFSESWLREWVNPSINTEQLSEQLSMAGLEVDDVCAVADTFSGVVVGKVVECGPHPDADKLQVTKVFVGADELLDIVCGAPNCRLGIKVAVATIGAVLPGDFKIKKAKLRGQPSNGMLCSLSELGMSDDHDGIVELPTDAPIGVDIREYLLLNDMSIDVDLTPNRADCLGIKGIAREVGVLTQTDVIEPNIAPAQISIEDKREITVTAPEHCPTYLGRIIKNIDLSKQAPLWMKERLRRSGIRSIDAVVDVTNYVLLELGHPMHAFDNNTLEGNIVVRLAQENESITLLDQSTVALKTNTLLIADEHKALAMAGIFGGLDSSVTNHTTEIFLESAYFSPELILGNARQYGLHTDASHRYERGVDPELQMQAMERATALLIDIVGGDVGPITSNVSQSHLPSLSEVTLRKFRLQKVLGAVIPDERVTDILTRLGFDVTRNHEDWRVKVPTYRFDIAIEEDLIEEVARVYGYNNIENKAPESSLIMSSQSELAVPKQFFKNILLNKGYNEAITYSFVDPKHQQALFPNIEGLVLPHPISSEMSVMRVSLVTGLLNALSYNQKRQQSNIKLFETGLRFMDNGNSAICQQEMIAGVVCGNTFSEHWNIANEPVDFYHVKGDVENLLNIVSANHDVIFIKSDNSALHPGQSADILVNNEIVGWVGAIHPKFAKTLGLNGKVFGFELALDAISENNLPEIENISKYPVNRRDIAVTVDEDVEVGKLLKNIEKIGITELVDLNLFDVYQGEGIEPGFKSLAISIWLQSPNKTLEDAAIQASVNKVVQSLEENFGASLRD